MDWPLVKLKSVAPAVPIKHEIDDNFWLLNLDQIESDTGTVLQKTIVASSSIGTSTHGFDERHVLYSKLRPYLNKVALPDENGVATTELVPMLPDPERLDRNYLAYYLRSKHFVDWVCTQVAGAKMPRVSMQRFWQHEIPLPPLEEQKRIAAILDKVDVIRRKRQQAIQLADDFLRSVFLDMFGDPVTNPKGWEVKKLGDVIKLSSGNGLSAKDMDSAGCYPVYGGNGINGHHSEFMFENPQLVIGRVGVYCGAIHITQPNSWVTDNALYIKEYLTPVNIHYLAQLLDIANLNQYAGRAAQPLVSGSRIYPLKMIFPPIEIQNKFQQIKEKLTSIKLQTNTATELTESTFSSLNQKAFRGEL